MYFKYELMLSYLGIKGSIMNGRLEETFDDKFSRTGFYFRYFNEDSDQEELAKIITNPQKPGYKYIAEIYKYNEEDVSNLRKHLSETFNIEPEKFVLYASFPTHLKDKNISSLRNFELDSSPDKLYWDVSSLKNEIPNFYEYIGVDKKLLKEDEEKINWILTFDVKTLEMLGLFYHILGSKAELLNMFKNSAWVDDAVPRKNLVTAFEMLTEATEELNGIGKKYLVGLQEVKLKEENKYKFKKFVYTYI